MSWEDIVKAPQKRGSIGFRVSDGKYSMISEENEATWLLQELVEHGANVEEVIDLQEVKDFHEVEQIHT